MTIIRIQKAGRRRYWAVGALAASLIASGAITYLALDVGKLSTAASVKDHSYGQPLEVSPRTEHLGAPNVVIPAVVVEVPGETMSKAFDRLAATHKPAELFKAYELAAKCQTVTNWTTAMKQQANEVDPQVLDFLKKSVGDVQAACGDLTQGQIASRLEYLRIAAEAGVHGAFGALTHFEGPKSPNKSYSDDETYRALTTAALAASLKTADPYTLQARSEYLSNCGTGGTKADECTGKVTKQDLAQAFMYWVAYREASAIEKHEVLSEQPDLVSQKYLKTLPADVAQKAIADAKTLVADARGQK